MRGSMLKLKEEERLLVLIVDASMRKEGYDETVRERAASIMSGPFVWDRFMRLAGQHLSLSVVHRFCEDLGLSGNVPSNVRQALETEYLLAQARFLKKEHELLEVVRRLEKAGVAPIVIKGVALAQLLYKDRGTRASRDIDLLIPQADMERAQEVLLGSGYALRTDARSAEDYRDYHFHYVFGRGENLDSIVELHWNLLDPTMDYGTADVGELREQARSFEIGGETLRTLGLPHAFWHMGIHAAQNYFLAFRSLA
jgi:hypothetical protein